MQSAIDGETLLALWERALANPAGSRGDALLGDPQPGGGAAPPRTLGERNAQLAALHARLFGRDLDLLSHCPVCGTAAQFRGDCEALAGAPAVAAAETQLLAAGGHRIEFRLPGTADVTAAAQHPDQELFARALLERCVIACTRDGEAVPSRALPAELLDALSRRLEELDPAASISFTLQCPQCATWWDARLDLAHDIWRKLQDAAERLLLDIDTLARAYGWTERDVMALSPTRRAAYVQMAVL